MSSSSKLVRSLLSTSTRTSSRSAILPTTRRLQQASRSNFNKNIPNKTVVRQFHSTTVKMGVHNIESKAAFDEALKNDVVVVDCFATWCGPCKVIAPRVVQFSDDYPSVHFVKLDVDEVPNVAQELGIRAMPTFLIYKGGEKVKEIVGANPQALQLAIEQFATEKK